MKDSTNLTFIIKILALLCLLIVGLTKNDIFPTTEVEKQNLPPNETELSSYDYLIPATSTIQEISNSNSTLLVSKK